MAWHLPGDKPLSETMMVNLPMHTLNELNSQESCGMYIVFWQKQLTVIK